MALVKDKHGANSGGLQHSAVASGTLAVTELGTQTDDYVVAEIPAGAVVVRGDVHVLEAFDGATKTVDVDLVDLDGANPIVVHAAADGTAPGRTVVNGAAITGVALVTPHYLVMRCDGTDNTTGQATACLDYYVLGRADENTG